jgi:penicillin-binding protein 1C
VVVAEDGTPLWRFADAQGVWRYPVALDDVSPRYLQALIQYEDRWFWRHPGVNPFAVIRAAWQDLTSGRVISGGSTLTMQVARLLDPHPRTFGGKLRQLWRALQLEWHLSKSEILTLYLNRAPLAARCRGSARPAGPISVNPRAAQLWRSGAAGGAAAGAEPFTSGPLAAAGSGGAR